MQARRIITRVRGAIKRHGVLGMAAVAPRAAWFSLRPFLPGTSGRFRRHREREEKWDLEHGIETRGVIHPANLDACSDNWVHGSRYVASDPVDFDRLMGAAPVEYAGLTFVDIGSGKGRVLFMAAGYPFRRIVGVEYSRELHGIALENVRRRGMEGRIEVVCADAVGYELPREPVVIFLYNPFDGAVMRPFVKRVEASLRENGRTIFVFYLNPVEAGAWDESKFFRRVVEGREGEAFVVWRGEG